MALSEPAEFGHPDFILLEEITEAAFMANLKLRYEKGKVYRRDMRLIPPLSHTLSLSLSLFLSHITHTYPLSLSLSLSLGSVSSALDEASFICIIFCSSESMHNSEVGTANYKKWL